MKPSDYFILNIAIYKAISDEQNLELINQMKQEYEQAELESQNNR